VAERIEADAQGWSEEVICIIEPPPAVYDHYARNWHVIVGNPTARCDKLSCACTMRTSKGCITWITPQYMHSAALLRHERAHCNGWRHRGDTP